VTTNVELVFNGFCKLSDSEKKDVIDAIIDYQKADIKGRRAIVEGSEKRARIQLGPVGTLCPCCGRLR
jgi:hypothetical protein